MNLAIHARKELEPDDELGLARLLAACEETDGYADLPLDKSLNHDPDMPSFFLAKLEGGPKEQELLGILSVFAPLAAEAEISSFVHPLWRGQGIFRTLLAEAESALASTACMDELFVCESGQTGGASTVARLGARKDFTEYALVHPGDGEALARLKAAAAAAPLELKLAGEEDLEVLVGLMAQAFNSPREDEESMVRAALAGGTKRQFLALAGTRVVGAAALGYKGDTVSIYGVGIAPEERGRGYGKSLVASLALRIIGEGRQALIDVDSSNTKAHHVYASIGFQDDKAIDYWRRPFPR
jgi:ribosomal protein S18 acetylase RimI-like enzyme